MRPDVIPQLADAAEVLMAAQRRPGVSFSVLIPNERGLERALEMRDRFDEVSVFLSASETHNQHNVNRSVEESLAGLEATLATRRRGGAAPRGRDRHLLRLPLRGRRWRPSASSRSPSGWPPPAARRSASATPPGWRTRARSHEFFAAARERLAGVELTAHFHNTRGQGLANLVAALEEGVESFESSFGELGGCPVPPGSTGNVGSEDVVSMLHEMGVETGIDLPRLIEASRAAQEVLGRPLGAHVLRGRRPVGLAAGRSE